MKYLLLAFLVLPLSIRGATLGVSYDSATRGVFQTDLDQTFDDIVADVGAFTTLTKGAVTVPNINNATWFSGGSASETWTFNLSAGDPVITFGNGVVNVTTGTLQQGGVAVVTAARSLTAGVGLTGGGDLSADRTFTLDLSELTDNQTIWSGASASRTITFNLSAGDPVLTLSSGVFNISSGTLQFAGNTVATAANNLSFFAATTSAQFFGVLSDEVGTTGFAIRVAGTASNGFVPVSDGAGVITWSAQSGGGGGGTVGTVVNTGASTQYALPRYSDTTGTNIAPSLLLTDATGTNFYAGGFLINSLTVTNPIPVTSGGLGIATGTSGGIPYFSASTTIASSAALAANALVVGGGAGAAPSTVTTGAGNLTALAIAANAAGGFVTDNGTATLTGKTLDAGATGNVLLQTKQLNLQRPDYGDGIGAVPQTNAFNVSGLMHYTFSGNAETNANYVVYEFDCPSDLNTAVEITARFAFLSGGTDTDDYVFHLTYGQVAPGTAYPTGTTIATSPIVMTVTPTTAANGDFQSSGAVTLTGWAAALTPGRAMTLRIARLQNTQDDGARDVQLVITYGSTL